VRYQFDKLGYLNYLFDKINGENKFNNKVEIIFAFWEWEMPYNILYFEGVEFNKDDIYGN